MTDTRKFAFDVGITFLASVITLPLGFIITIVLGKYLGASDLGLYRMTSTVYGIAMLIGAFGIPAAMIKCVAEFKDDKAKFLLQIIKKYFEIILNNYIQTIKQMLKFWAQIFRVNIENKVINI